MFLAVDEVDPRVGGWTGWAPLQLHRAGRAGWLGLFFSATGRVELGAWRLDDVGTEKRAWPGGQTSIEVGVGAPALFFGALS